MIDDLDVLFVNKSKGAQGADIISIVSRSANMALQVG
jgi:hypothetical protein